jgi:CRP/FNR family nitrogen fixation transcriptional regulator
MGNISCAPAAQDHDKDFKVRHCKGATIYAQADRASHWFEIISGAVRTSRIRADGGRRVTGFFFPGDVIGVAAGRRVDMAEALTDTLLCVHPTATLAPDGVAPGLGSPLHRALESAQASLFLLGRGSAEERLAAFLISLAIRVGQSNVLPLVMGRDDIADHLGMTPYTVSRTLRRMERSGIVACVGRHSMRILKPGVLLELVGEEWPTGETLIPAWYDTAGSRQPATPSPASQMQPAMS